MSGGPDRASEVRAWVEANWDESITVREWWRRLFEAGYAYPVWPEGMGGLGLSTAESRLIHGVLATHRVVGPPTGHVAATLAAPTILAHGTAEQIERFVKPIGLGEAGWCQLFSEPGSGSDLASVGAKAVRDGDEWIVTGQKVWNSGADASQQGMLLARTDVDLPKHRGMSYFVIDMEQDGVEARPLKQMNGMSSFCEVFLDEARVPADQMIGELNDGWNVAQTTLASERAMVAGGGLPGLAQARSGEPAGDLDRSVGEIVARTRKTAKTSSITSGAIRGKQMIELAREHGVDTDPVIRQRLAAYHSQIKVNGWLSRRIGAARGRLTGADGSIAKLTTSRICQDSRDLSFAIIGAATMLDGDDAPLAGAIQRVGLGSPGNRIGGGTDEIQLNVLGERGLGLPREPGDDRSVPYRDLLVGTQR